MSCCTSAQLWMDESARALRVGADNYLSEPISRRTTTVEIDLSSHLVRDYPVSQGSFVMTVYEDDIRPGIPPIYKNVDCAFSQSIRANHIWEGFETALVCDLLSKRQIGSVVLDFGACLGWYSIIAASLGWSALAVELDGGNADLISENARRNGFDEQICVVAARVGPSTPQLTAGPSIGLLKSDVEGCENDVVRVCQRLFEQKLIAHALLEITPGVWHYPDTFRWIVEQGYSAFLVPDKGSDVVAFSADPRGETMRFRIDGPELERNIGEMGIRNVLFSRGTTA